MDLTFFGKIDKWITINAGYLALAVIIGWTIQLLIAGGMVMMTVVMDGITAGIAALYASYVSYHIKWTKCAGRQHAIGTQQQHR